MGTSVSALQLAAEGGAVSDRTRELRDAEQQHLADEAMRRAVRLHHRAPRRSSTSSPTRCCATRCSSARTSSAIMAGVPIDAAAHRPARPRCAAAEPTDVRQPFLSVQVSALRGRLHGTMGAADDFRALLEPGAIRAVFQPIVRLTDLETIGYEGLARFPTPPGLVALPPDVMLAAARRRGPARRPRGRLLVGDRRRRRAAARPPAVGQPVAGGARPPGAARGRRPAAVSGS